MGRAIAVEFASQGADVVLHYAHHDEGVHVAEAQIKALGRRTISIKADFAKLEELTSLAGKALDFLGGIDCLVNNAGISFNKPFGEVTVELAHRGIRVNAIAPGWVTVENYYKYIEGFSEDAARLDAADKVPLGRSGETVEIAKLAAFLSSEDSGYIVGQTIVADGGTVSLMSLISDFRHRSSAKFGKGYVPGV
jgi:NAD(P)-dependent dehydrogenase (short-subunit alcohol dehydrogenase family)